MKKKILIVDDDTIIHETFDAVLSSDEFEVIHAYDGRSILERVINEQPDLVILDVMMPVRDGRDICRDIRKNPNTKDTIILMLSAKNEHFDRILGLELGANDYITKPFNPLMIANKVKKMCGIELKS